MKKLSVLMVFLIGLLGTGAQAQNPAYCDSLIVTSLTFAPFDTSAIEILVENTSSQLFSYPGFILLNLDGDTLAKEEVQYFGIAGSQAFYPALSEVYDIPSGTSDFVLELWTGFYAEKACSYSITENLCPAISCIPVEFYFGNYGNGLVVSDFSLTISDTLGLVIFEDSFALDSLLQAAVVPFCLEPGWYDIHIDQSAPIIEGQSVFGLNAGQWMAVHPEGSYNNSGDGNSLRFYFFQPCIPVLGLPDNSSLSPSLFTVSANPEGWRIDAPQNEFIARLSVFDLQGRLLETRDAHTHALILDRAGYPSGLIFVKVQTRSGLSQVIKLVQP